MTHLIQVNHPVACPTYNQQTFGMFTESRPNPKRSLIMCYHYSHYGGQHRNYYILTYTEVLTRHVNDSNFLNRFNMSFTKIELVQLTTRKILNEMIRFNSLLKWLLNKLIRFDSWIKQKWFDYLIMEIMKMIRFMVHMIQINSLPVWIYLCVHIYYLDLA